MTLRSRLLAATRENTPEFSLGPKLRLCRVLSVYDGDTVRIALRVRGRMTQWNCRMHGYDCSEIRPSRSLPEEERIAEKAKAIAARDYLRGQVMGEKTLVFCRPHGFDKYGRLLTTLFYERKKNKVGANINHEMVTLKHGYPYSGGNKAQEKAAAEALAAQPDEVEVESPEVVEVESPEAETESETLEPEPEIEGQEPDSPKNQNQ